LILTRILNIVLPMLSVVPMVVVLAAAPTPWAHLAGTLQYLDGDYPPAVASHDESELTEQRGFAQDAYDTAVALGPEAQALLPELASIRDRIGEAKDPEGVSRDCRALALKVIELGHLEVSPRRPPDLALGQQVWTKSCAACHGANGDAATDVAKALKPPPANFHDEKVMGALTPYKAFNVTAFGVKGTAMVPLPDLSDDERWAVSFFLFTLRQPACAALPEKHATLEQLATSTDGQLGPNVACLRRVMPALDKTQALFAARDGVEKAMGLHQAGKIDAAKKELVDAYLNGVEPIEPLLRARDATRVSELEGGFTRMRLAAGDARRFDAEGATLVRLLDKTARGGTASDFWSVMLTAMLILLREGFEALVVVVALLAVLKKMGATSHARTVHLGWSSALVAGGIAFALGHSLLAAADREWMETLVGFVAVGMLVYAALWLNARANTSRFMGELREKMTGALGRGSAFGLFAIAFTAVGRESFETALFLEGLAGDSLKGAVYGAGLGMVALALLVAFVVRVGFRLPMKTLFNASTVMLVATAVVMLGKSIHGLQELGVLPLLPLPFVELPALGVFSDAFTLLPQLVLALLPLLWAKRRVAMHAA
jgi:high-affinity iron transporter